LARGKPKQSAARKPRPAEEIVLLLNFQSLELASPILESLAREGYETPTPIQSRAIPHALAGRDLLGIAQTGTGKTAAFALPVLHRLHTTRQGERRGPVKPRALVLSPTRELATQIAESFAVYGKGTRLRHAVIFGGVSQFHQVKALRAGVDIIVATPGRLMDLMAQGHVDLRSIEVFVLDEADRMLDMGFIQPIRKVAEALPAARQTMLFSATMPDAIARLAASLLRNPERVEVDRVASAAPKIEQSVFMVANQEKPALLERLLAEHAPLRALVFTRTKHGADRLTDKLLRAGVSAESIHGNKSQGQRQRALDAFRSGRSRVLVATDVAARGLDVDGITHVFNFNLPNEPEAYVHRIGRTGRAGAAGIAISFCDHEERAYLRSIERLIGTRLAPEGGHEPENAPIDNRPRRNKPASRPKPQRKPERPAPEATRDPRPAPAGARPSHKPGMRPGKRRPQLGAGARKPS
jgi:ATP-dependent RNA helicase RhlE